MSSRFLASRIDPALTWAAFIPQHPTKLGIDVFVSKFVSEYVSEGVVKTPYYGDNKTVFLGFLILKGRLSKFLLDLDPKRFVDKTS